MRLFKLDKKFLLLLLISPFFVWFLMRPVSFLKEWGRFFTYSRANITSIFAPDKLFKVEETRWNAFGSEREDVFSRLFYNKGFVLVDNLFNYLTFVSPRLFFQAGDGTPFSAPRVEPIAIPLFFFFVLGIIYLLKKKQTKELKLVAAFSFLAFAAGRKTFAFLLPVGIVYLYISYLGIAKSFSKKTSRVVFKVLAFYLVFLLGRAFLI